jgi:hypothetical protein
MGAGSGGHEGGGDEQWTQEAQQTHNKSFIEMGGKRREITIFFTAFYQAG